MIEFYSYILSFNINGPIGKRSLDRISVDRNCVLSVDRNCGNHLIKFFDTFHLIESLNNEFGQTPKNSLVDRIIRSTAKIHQFFFGS
jgi:hypothetical protein